MNAKFAVTALATILAASLDAATIDMNDPRRALGREDDVRIDAQLLNDTVTPGAPIGVTWQIQNLTDMPVAVATKVCDASYDPDSRTITVAIGSEVPSDGTMPQMTVIAPGEKKVFRAAATPVISPAASRSERGSAPRYVQVKVSILRRLEPFLTLIKRQSPTAKPEQLSDELFDQWFESTDTIFLNSLPVQWNARAQRPVDVEQRGIRF